MKMHTRLIGLMLASLAGLFLAGCAATPQKSASSGAGAAGGQAVSGAGTGSASAMAGADHYTVQRGDCLWTIAAKPSIHGNPYEWPLIYRNNHTKIHDADLIYPGQVLEIRNDATPAQIKAAEQHARTRGPWALGPVEQSDLDYLNQ